MHGNRVLGDEDRDVDKREHEAYVCEGSSEPAL